MLLFHPGRCKISVTCTGGTIFQVKLKKNPQLLLYIYIYPTTNGSVKASTKRECRRLILKDVRNRTPYYYMHVFHYFIFHNCNTCLFLLRIRTTTQKHPSYTYIYVYVYVYIDNHFFYSIYVYVIFLQMFLFFYFCFFIILLVRSTREQRKLLLVPIRKVFPNLVLRIGRWPKRTEKNKCRENEKKNRFEKKKVFGSVRVMNRNGDRERTRTKPEMRRDKQEGEKYICIYIYINV